MVSSLSIRVLVACWYAAIGRTPYSCISTGHQDSYREWRYHMLLVYNYVLLKMSTWCSKHVEESNILRINNSQCIKLVIIVYEFNNSVHLSITSSLLEFNLFVTPLLNSLNIYSLLNTSNQVLNTNKQHVKQYITYLNHYGFLQETKEVKDISHNSWST